MIRRFLQQPFDKLLASSSWLHNLVGQASLSETKVAERAAGQLRMDPSFPARFWPRSPGQAACVIPKSPPQMGTDPVDGLPIPPRELWAGYGATAEEYVQSGREHFESMQKVLSEAGFTPGKGCRVLDFGCAAGRMTRCFHSSAGEMEVWGVDQSAEHVGWCQATLSPPLRFLTTTTFPHLPFEDNTFDLIFACSVFTHISDLEDAWLMELRRITRPGGFLYITVHDNHTIDLILSSPPGHWLHDTPMRRELLAFEAQHHFLESEFRMFFTSRAAGNSQVYHDREYIEATWGQYMSILSITPEAYGYQTAVTLQK